MAAVGEVHPIPFNSGTQEVIYENNTLRFLIYKKDFERQVYGMSDTLSRICHVSHFQIRYALDDHLFKCKVELQPGVHDYPHLKDMCGVIERVIFNILTKLRQYYSQPHVADDTYEMEVDITIAENNLSHGIHIGKKHFR